MDKLRYPWWLKVGQRVRIRLTGETGTILGIIDHLAYAAVQCHVQPDGVPDLDQHRRADQPPRDSLDPGERSGKIGGVYAVDYLEPVVEVL